MRKLFPSLDNTLNYFGLRRGKKSKQTRQIKNRALQVEPLERRELLAILAWSPNPNVAPYGGTGDWSATGAWINTSVTPSVRCSWTDGNEALFKGTSGDVTLSQSVSATKITFQEVDDYTISGSPLTLTGSGPTITANQSATINSAIYVNADQQWTVGNEKALSIEGQVIMNSANLTIQGGGETSISSGLYGDGGLTKVDEGSMFLNNIYYSGGTTISGGILQLGDEVSSMSGDIGIYAEGALVFDISNDFSFLGSIGGEGAIRKSGVGTLNLYNSTSWIVENTEGSLNFYADCSMGDCYVGSFYNDENADLNFYYDAISSPNGIWCDAIYNAGDIQVEDGGLLGTVVADINGDVILGDEAILVLGQPIYNRLQALSNVALCNEITWDIGGFSLSANISGGGSLVISGSDPIVISGNNTYTGDTLIYENIVTVGSTNAIPRGPGAGNVFIDEYGVLDLNGIDISLNGLSGGGQIWNTNANPSILTVGENNQPSDFSGMIYEEAGAIALHKIGSQPLSLSGSNYYTGGTTIENGTVSFAYGSLGTTGNIALTGDSTLQWAAGHTQDISSRLVLNNGITATLDVGYNNVLFASGIGVDTSASIVKTGNGTLMLTGANNYSGTTTISAGTLQIGNNGTTGTLGNGAVTNNSILRFTRSNNLIVPNVISGTGTLQKSGSGVLTLLDDYIGPITVYTGTVNKYKIINPNPDSIDEGDTYPLTIKVSFITPATSITQKQYRYRVNWGDGNETDWATKTFLNPHSNTFYWESFAVDHIFADNDAMPIQLEIVDNDAVNDIVALTKNLSVANVAPTLSAPSSITIKEGQLLDLTDLVTFSDPGFDSPLTDPPTSEYFTYSVIWRDGESDTDVIAYDVTQGGPGVSTQGKIDIAHLYAASGTYEDVTVTVRDDDGDSVDTESFDVTVVKPTMSIDGISGENSAVIGEEYKLTLGAVTIPGENTVQGYTVHWGDGSSDYYTAAEITANSQVAHVYADVCIDYSSGYTYTISVDLDDADGTYTDVASISNIDVTPFSSSGGQMSAFVAGYDMTFDNKEMNYKRIASFGASYQTAGQFQINVPTTLPGNLTPVTSLTPGGVVCWNPNLGGEYGNYTVEALYTVGNHTWSKPFTVHIENTNLPPVYGQHDILLHVYREFDGSETPVPWTSDEIYPATDPEGSTLTYSIIKGQSNLSDNAVFRFDDATGSWLFSCTFSTEDSQKVFDFYIQATDGMKIDRQRVLIGVNNLCVGDAHVIVEKNSPATSTYNRISLGLDPRDYSTTPVFTLCTEPAHGDFDLETDAYGHPTGYGFYTPNTGYTGPDSFTFNWTVASNTSNNARMDIQVGPFVKLESALPPLDDRLLIPVGVEKDLMLTLQNPRADGLPVTGYWTLNIPDGLLHVYYQGKEIVSSQKFFEDALSGAKIIMLKIKAESANTLDITAEWHTWNAVSRINDDGWSKYARLSLISVIADIDVDSNNDGVIDPINGPFGSDDRIEDQKYSCIIPVDNYGVNDLTRVVLNPIGIFPTAANQVVAKLTSTGNIRVWAFYNRTSLLIDAPGGSVTWDTFSEAWPEFYIEGLAIGDATLELKVTINGQDIPIDTVAIKITVPWKRFCEWTSNIAYVEAGIKDASLGDLAYDITGNSDDVALLDVHGPITRGKKINVMPLLNELEKRIREGVVAAAGAAKHAIFGHVEGAERIATLMFQESQVNRIFLGGVGADPTCDCNTMVMLEFAYGVITQLKPREFDSIGFHPFSFDSGCNFGPVGGRGDWQAGDWIEFDNFDGYQASHPNGGAWGQEQTIKMKANDSYYGFGRSGNHSSDWWRNELLTEYNTGLPESQQITIDLIPQPFFRGFINVPRVAMEIFDLRTDQGDYLP